MHLHVLLVHPDELPEGQEWIFVEVSGELHILLSEVATGEAMARGLEVAKGLLAEIAERKRLALASFPHQVSMSSSL